MKILIGQPKHDNALSQLKIEINSDVDLILYPEGYLSMQKVEKTCKLAKDHKKIIVTGYKDALNKDKALIINKDGKRILDRDKTPINKELYDPLIVNIEGKTLGYILCMEILKGKASLKRIKQPIDIIFHPIGVGMFSDEQFDEWINYATDIAKTYKTKIIGTSHADRSYRNCGVSLPIAYYINEDGHSILISTSDTRSRVVNLFNNEIKYIEL